MKGHLTGGNMNLLPLQIRDKTQSPAFRSDFVNYQTTTTASPMSSAEVFKNRLFIINSDGTKVEFSTPPHADKYVAGNDTDSR